MYQQNVHISSFLSWRCYFIGCQEKSSSSDWELQYSSFTAPYRWKAVGLNVPKIYQKQYFYHPIMLSLSHPGSVSSRLIVPFLVRESGHKGNLHQSSSFLRQDFASYLWSELKFQSLQNISWELLLYFATKYSDVVCLIYMGESYVEKFLHFVWWCRAEIMITASYKRGERWRGKGLTQILNNIVFFKWMISLEWTFEKVASE